MGSSYLFEGNIWKRNILQCLVFSPKYFWQKKGPLFSSWRWNKQNSPAAHLHVEQRRQQLQKSIICFLVGSPYYHSSFSALSRWLPANMLHPQRPPSQHFVNFWQPFFFLFFLFFLVKAHVGAPAPYPLPLYHSTPGEWSPLVLWLQKHAKYLPWHLNIVLPEGHPSTRKEGRERGIESWMKASQPSIYPHLTLQILMQSLFQICRLCNVLCSQGPIWNLV